MKINITNIAIAISFNFPIYIFKQPSNCMNCLAHLQSIIKIIPLIHAHYCGTLVFSFQSVDLIFSILSFLLSFIAALSFLENGHNFLRKITVLHFLHDCCYVLTLTKSSTNSSLYCPQTPSGPGTDTLTEKFRFERGLNMI